jgi:hypothetical protein
MVSILSSINVIHSFLDVPKGATRDTAFCTDAVIPSLIEIVWSRTRRKMLNGWLIRIDHARLHNSGRAQRCIEGSRAECLAHLTYSPYLATSGFFFGYTKGKLSDYNCEGHRDLLKAITEMFTGVDQEMVLSIFESWVNRRKCVIKHEGTYYAKSRLNRNHFFKIGRENGRT